MNKQFTMSLCHIAKHSYCWQTTIQHILVEMYLKFLTVWRRSPFPRYAIFLCLILCLYQMTSFIFICACTGSPNIQIARCLLGAFIFVEQSNPPRICEFPPPLPPDFRNFGSRPHTSRPLIKSSKFPPYHILIGREGSLHA